MIGERANLLIKEIDIALNRIGEALMRAQPPYSGKLTIKFVDEGADELTPTVQKLQITRGGTFFPIRVPPSRLASRAAWKSSFSINYHLVKKLLMEAEYLMDTRKAINIKLRQIKHWESTFCSSHEQKVDSSKAQISELHVAVEENLRGRTTRTAKNDERERLGIPTIVVENKYSKKRKYRRTSTPKPKPKDAFPGSEQDDTE